MPTIKELVLRQLSVDPDIRLKACQKVVPGLTKPNFYKVKRQLKDSSRPSKPKTKGSRKGASTPSTPDNRTYKKLNNEVLKEMTLAMLNGELDDKQERRLKIAIDFIKGIKMDSIDMEELDMAGFIKEIRDE